MNTAIRNTNQLQEQHEDLLGNFQVGETVYLNRFTIDETLVTIVKFGNRLCRVKDVNGYEIEVMIYRLSKP